MMSDADIFMSWPLRQTIKEKKKIKQGRSSKTHERSQGKKEKIESKQEKEKTKENKKEKKVEKKKRKKKKKHKLALELDNHLKFTQTSCTQAKPKEKSKVANQCRKKKPSPDNLAEDSMKKKKRKKRVGFGSLPNFIRAKHPKLASSSPKDTGHSQVQADGNDSGDDMNSQDLFITQKTFRATPPEASSSGSSEGAFTQQYKDLFTAAGERKLCPRESRVNLSDGRKLSGDVEPTVVNPYLVEQVAVNRTPDAISWKSLSSCPPFIYESSLLAPSTVSTSTQTENFFTAELPSYIGFYKKSPVTADLENLKPLDLSLPHRVRRDLCLSVKMSVIDRDNDVEEPHDQETSLLMGGTENRLDIGPSGSSQITQIDIKEFSGQGETTLSPKSDADPRFVDSTASSEDDPLCRSGKRDLAQVRAVQMKLNRPFFFKTKGEGLSPRPESPLMKLSQGREVKIKKRR